MGWIAVGLFIASMALTLYLWNNMPSGMRMGDVRAPTASEGLSIPVVFGERVVSPNVLWAGAGRSEGDTPAWYYLDGIMLGICHGKLDAINKVYFGEKEPLETWGYSDAFKDPTITLVESWNDDNAMSGTFRYNFGLADYTQGYSTGVTDAIAKCLGMTTRPKFSGVAWAVSDSLSLGHSSYTKPITFRVKRIHTRFAGTVEQWYDEKAEITIGNSREDYWKYHLQALADETDCSGVAFDDSAWPEGRGGFGNATVNWKVDDSHNDQDEVKSYHMPVVKTNIADNDIAYSWPPIVQWGAKIWVRQDLGALPSEPLGVRCWHDDTATLWFNGTPITLTPIVSAVTDRRYDSRATIPASLIVPAGPNIIAYRVANGIETKELKFIYAGISVGPDLSQPEACVAMNPAHIIRECLTDAIWGCGWGNDRIGDSFEDVADTLYDEGFGMSVEWSEQAEIGDFISEILKAIGGNLYVDRITGKWEIMLIRDDYDVETLPELDASNVASVDNVSRQTVGELVNAVFCEYSRTPSGTVGSVPAIDQGLVTSQGCIISQSVQYPGVRAPHIASKIAHRDLSLMVNPPNSYEIRANRSVADWNVGDPFLLTWADLGAASRVLRVVEISADDIKDNYVTIKAMDDAFYLPDAAITGTSTPDGPPDTTTAPNSKRLTLHSARMADPDNKGQVVCVYCEPGEGGIFGDWTQVEPGVWQRNTIGELTDDYFDGVDPDVNNTNGSSLVGRTFLAHKATSITDRQHEGPYILDDIGCEWYQTGDPPAWAKRDTYARMHRHPDFSKSEDFVQGMTFQCQTGDTYGTDYFSLDNSEVLLGTTELTWTLHEGPTYAWDEEYTLLTRAQLTEYNARMDTLVMSHSATNGTATFDNDLVTLFGTPGMSSIPAGLWTIREEGVYLSAAAPEGTETRLKIQIWRFYQNMYSLLFEALSDPITATTAEPLPDITFEADTVAFDVNFYLLKRYQVVTDSLTAVTLNVVYNSPFHGSGLILPGVPDPTTTTTTGTDEEWFEVTITNGIIAGFGDHRKLLVNGTGPLIGIESVGLTSGTKLDLTFVNAVAIQPNTETGASTAYQLVTRQSTKGAYLTTYIKASGSVGVKWFPVIGELGDNKWHMDRVMEG